METKGKVFQVFIGDTVSSYTCGRIERQKDLAKLLKIIDKVKFGKNIYFG